MNERIRLDGIDVDKLEYLRDEVTRISNDLHVNCETARHLDDAIESLNDAVESGKGTTTDDWTPGNDRTSDSGQTDPDDWTPK